MKIIQIKQRRHRNTLIDTDRVAASWNHDTRFGGETFSLLTLPDEHGQLFRVELSRKEVERLAKYLEEDPVRNPYVAGKGEAFS